MSSVASAFALLETEARIDGAVLDISLQGEMVFAVAEHLMQRRIPFVFATGYDADSIPGRFGGAHRCEKPLNADQLRDAPRLGHLRGIVKLLAGVGQSPVQQAPA